MVETTVLGTTIRQLLSVTTQTTKTICLKTISNKVGLEHVSKLMLRKVPALEIMMLVNNIQNNGKWLNKIDININK